MPRQVNYFASHPRSFAENEIYSVPNPFSGGHFTISAWVKPNAVHTGRYHGILGAQVDGGRSPSLWLSYAAGLHYDLRSDAGRFTDILEDFFAADTWTHVAWVYDGQHSHFYRDGELRARVPAPPTYHIVSQQYGIGGVDNHFNGDVFQVCFYDHALTPDEVRAALATHPDAPERRAITVTPTPLDITDGSEQVTVGERQIKLTPGSKGWTFRGKLNEGETINLTEIAEKLLEVDLPPELPEIEFTTLELSVTPNTGAFEAKATRATRWALPFGGSVLHAGITELHARREAKQTTGQPGIIRATVKVTTDLDAEIFDGFRIGAGTELYFQLNPLAEAEEEAEEDLFAAQTPPEETPASPKVASIPPDVWVIGGAVKARLFDAEFGLYAWLTTDGQKRTLKLEGKIASTDEDADHLLSIGDLAWVEAGKLTVEITRRPKDQPPAAKPDATGRDTALDVGKRLSLAAGTRSAYAYDWSVTAEAGLGVALSVGDYHASARVAGSLSAYQNAETVGLLFTAPEAEEGKIPPGVALPVPFFDQPFRVHASLDRVAITGTQNQQTKKRDWKFEAAASVELLDLGQDARGNPIARPTLTPTANQFIAWLDDRLPRTQAALTIDGDGVALKIDRFTEVTRYDLPPVRVRDLAQPQQERYIIYDVAPGALDLTDTRLKITRAGQVTFTFDLALGIPAAIRVGDGDNPVVKRVLDNLSRILPNIVRLYLPEIEGHDGFIRFRAGFQAEKKRFAVRMKLINSPFPFIEFEQVEEDGETTQYITLDSQRVIKQISGTDLDFGAIRFKVPSFTFNGVQVGAEGSFEIKRPLRLPLTPARQLLKGTGKFTDQQVKTLIPLDSISLMSLKLIKADGTLNTEELRRWLSSMVKQSLDAAQDDPETVKKYQKLHDDILEFANKIGNRGLSTLPAELLPYFNFDMPTELEFDFAVSADGGMRLNIGVGDDSPPIRWMQPTPAGLVGYQLRRIAFGEVIAGALLLLEVDVVADVFDWVSLVGGVASSVALPRQNVIAPGSTLLNRAILKDLLMFIVWESGIPIPIPVFFTEVGAEMRHILNFEAQMHVGFPMPSFNLIELGKVAKELFDFIIKPDYLLSEGGDGKLIDVVPADSSATDLRLTFGSNFLRLPPYITNKRGEPFQLGTQLRDSRVSLSGRRYLASLLNASKKLSTSQLIKSLPINLRVNQTDLSLFSLFDFAASWLVTTPYEFSVLRQGGALLDQPETRKALGYVDLNELAASDADRASFRAVWSDFARMQTVYQRLFLDNPQALADTIAVETNQKNSVYPAPTDDGIFFFARGQLTLIANLLKLDTTLGFVSTPRGVATFFRGDGSFFNHLLQTRLTGRAFLIAKSPTDATAELDTHFYLHMLGSEVLDARAIVRDGQLGLSGRMDLFPNNPWLSVTGTVTGYVGSGAFALNGAMTVSVLNKTLELAGATLDLKADATGTTFALRGSLFGVAAELRVAGDQQVVKLSGSVTQQFQLIPNVGFTGANGSGGPTLDITYLRADGSISAKLEGRLIVGGLSYTSVLTFDKQTWKLSGTYSDGASTFRLDTSGTIGPNWLSGLKIEAQSYLFKVLDAEDVAGNVEEARYFQQMSKYAALRSAQILDPALAARYANNPEKLTPVGMEAHNNPILNIRLHEQGIGTHVGWREACLVTFRSWRNNGIWTYGHNPFNGVTVGWKFLHGHSHDEASITWFRDNEWRYFVRGIDGRLYSTTVRWDWDYVQIPDYWHYVRQHYVAPNSVPTATRRYVVSPNTKNNEIIAVHKGTDGKVWATWWDTTRSADNPHGTQAWNYGYFTDESPVVVSLRNGTDLVYQVADSNKLSEIWWGGWKYIFTNQLFASPVSVTYYMNAERVALAARNQRGYVALGYPQHNADYAVELTGLGRITGKPAIAQHKDRIHIFARSAVDGRLLHGYVPDLGQPYYAEAVDWWKEGTSSPAFNFPILGSPGVHVNGDHLLVFAQSAHGSLVRMEYRPGNTWRVVDGGVPSGEL